MSTTSFIQRINVVTGTKEWHVEPEEYDYHQEVARSAYADMLHDHDRNMKYYKGLELAIEELHRRGEKAIVLDIGTGTGLLSMMAAKLGADVIYACEAFDPMAKCAAKVISHNGYKDMIKLIPKRSTDLEVGDGKDLATRANVLVTEVFDTELIGEGAIRTYQHANEHLLTEDSFMIPTKAVYYALIVNCPIVASWNLMNPIHLSNDVSIRFPNAVTECPGVASVHDVQLSELKEDQFTQLSELLPVFTFDWTEKSQKILKFDSISLPFVSKANGSATAIFTWWDLQISSLDDSNNPSNIITMKPCWAGQDSVWRDHWMQAIYHIPKPLQLEKLVSYNLQAFHDEYSFWYQIVSAAEDLERNIQRYPAPPVCECGVHVALSRSRLGLFNDPERRKKYIKLLTPLVTHGTSCLVLSEGSSLPLILAGLGARKVFVCESNGLSLRMMENLAEYAGFKNTIVVLDNLDCETVRRLQLDFVVGDPIFHDAVLPWHNLCYWYTFQKMLTTPDVKLLPSKAVIKGIVVQYKDLWKIRSSVGTVCNGDFSIVDFDQIIHNSSEISDTNIDAQPLWEYPSTTCSTSFTLLKIDMTEPAEDQCTSGSVPVTGNPNGVSLWMEWIHTTENEDIVMSTGPITTSQISIGERLEWDKNSKQGVYFFPNSNPASSVSFQLKFTKFDGNIQFLFNKI